MQKSKIGLGVKFVLFTLFFLGVLLTAFVIIDAEVLHWWLKPPSISGENNNENQREDESERTNNTVTSPSNMIEKLRKSIVLIESRFCDNPEKGGTGTGFVVQAQGKTRFLATNAHVIRKSVDCNSFTVIDYTGTRHRAKMVGISLLNDLHNDMAVIKVEGIDDEHLPPLKLMTASEYRSAHDGKAIITIGYPVVGLASTYDKASVSGEGRVSQYDSGNNYYITSGLNANHGNSGGPVFSLDSYKVLGIAVAKVNQRIAENVAMVIPIEHFKQFFKEKTGRELQ